LKVDGDTIFGWLQVLPEDVSCHTIQFKDRDDQVVKFKMRDVLGYQRGEETFVKKSLPNPLSLGMADFYVKLLQKGHISLYEYSDNVESDDNIHTHIFEEYYLERGSQFVRVKKKRFKKDMSKFFSDHQEIVTKINNKEWKYKDLKEIVRIYNNDQKK